MKQPATAVVDSAQDAIAHILRVTLLVALCCGTGASVYGRATGTAFQLRMGTPALASREHWKLPRLPLQ